MPAMTKVDLSQIPLEQLLGDLATATPPAADSVDMWIESAPLYPGTHRVGATELYRQYADFIGDNPQLGKPKAIRCWGKVMARRFKAGRGKSGIFYYVSRERDVEIPTSQKTGV